MAAPKSNLNPINLSVYQLSPPILQPLIPKS